MSSIDPLRLYPRLRPMTAHTSGPVDPPWWRSNAYVALLLSAAIPGAGQVYAGPRRRGFWLLGITALLGAVLLILLGNRSMWLRWSVEPTALRWLLAGNGMLFAFRAYAAADAFASFKRPRSGTQPLLAAAGLMGASLVLLTVPHAWAGYIDVVQYDFITTVFAPEPTAAPPLARPPDTPSAPATDATPGPQPGSPTTPPPGPSPTILPTTTTVPTRIWDGTERLNVLLLGGDGGTGRTSIRTDTIILASIDPKTGHTALFSVPRNLARVPVPASLGVWDCDCFPGIINALWRWTDDRPNRFPDLADPSSEVLKLAIGTMTGLDIHYYALVNLAGFVEIIDAIGGVEITVPKRLYDPAYSGTDGVKRTIDMSPGDYHLDGEEALGYARSRTSSDDYNRMGRQRCVLTAVAAQSDTLTIIRAFPGIAAALKNNLFTDIPLERLPDFIELVPRIDATEIISVRFVPDRFTGARTPDRFPTPDLSEIRSVVEQVLALPPGEALEKLQLENVNEACG
jgi:LCP family protein required for cell wall assembly